MMASQFITSYAVELLGRRVLLSFTASRWGYGSGTVDELRVLEVSPSGRYVKLMNGNGRKFWLLASTVMLVETLADPAEPRPTT